MKSALTTVLITLLTLETVQTSSDIYKKVGDTVVIRPGSVDAYIESITWKHNSNLAVEWYGGLPDVYPKFKGRCTLNTTTGELTISGLTREDSGSYTPEINNRVLNPTKISLISDVPKPTVSESCDAEKTHCVLTCEGITTDSEPVTYTWWSGGVMKSETKELNITKEEKSSFFRCTMKNPVSTKSSKQVVNPVLISNTDNPDKYEKVGDTVVFSPDSVSATITSIVWKHGSTIAVKWDGGESVSYGDFKDCCTLKTTTGDLTISNLTPEDSGSYTVEINGDAIKTTKIMVISAVPTPTISTSCTAGGAACYKCEVSKVKPTVVQQSHCVLTCKVNAADAEPVTYTWWSGDVMKSQTNELNITKEENDDEFFCKVENPVSSKSSKVPNPSSTNEPVINNNSQSWIVGVVVGVVLIPVVGVGVVILVLYICKRKAKKAESSLPVTSEYDTVKYAKNGAANQENRPGDNETVEVVSNPSSDENNHPAEQTPAVSPESREPETLNQPLLENNHAAESSNQDPKNTEDNEDTGL